MDFSFDRWDAYIDALSDELMEFGIADDGNINEYGVSIDRLIGFMCIMKAEQQSGRAQLLYSGEQRQRVPANGNANFAKDSPFDVCVFTKDRNQR